MSDIERRSKDKSGTDGSAPGPIAGPSRPPLLSVLGPGLITGASDDDPSGIATYSQAGAQFGYELSWTLVLTFPLMTTVQMIAARIGRTTGKGIAGVLRKHYPNWILQWMVVLLVAANTVNIGADLGAMADAFRLILPAPSRWLLILFFAAICLFAQVFLEYTHYVAALKWLSLALFAYFASAIASGVDWRTLAVGLTVPSFKPGRDALTTIVAVLGTTISPYLFFWQAAQEVEDIHASPTRRRLVRAPLQGSAAVERIRLDTIVGMAFSNLVALAIMVTAAAALHAHGVTDIQTTAQAAEALRPIAGDFAFGVFALGVIGTGLLAVPVLAGSLAYALGEARDWPVGFSRRWQDAKAFYATVALAILVGMILNFTHIDPIKALYWSAVLNGVVAAPVMVAMMLISRRSDIMGAFVIGWPLMTLGWVTTALMGAAAAGMIALLAA